jgi:RNA polymerase sigma-70 factor, ECF subfamily
LNNLAVAAQRLILQKQIPQKRHSFQICKKHKPPSLPAGRFFIAAETAFMEKIYIWSFATSIHNPSLNILNLNIFIMEDPMFTQNALMSEIGKLQKFSLRLTRNKADADDLLQSTCLRALEKKDYFMEGTNLFSWTSKIMFNIFVSGYRRKAKFETKFDPEIYLEKQTIPPTQEIKAELAEVQRAMMKLSSDHREILILISAKGMRYDEISEMLHIPVGTVRSRLSRAREQLQTIMDTPRIPAYMASLALRKRA